LKPVFKVVTKDGKLLKDWKRLPSILKYTFNEEENIFTVKFSVQFSSDSSYIVYVAYGYPYSFTEITSKLDEI